MTTTTQNAAKRAACLLIHGYGGTPAEMTPIAGALEKAGIPARAICLPGHGADKDAFGAFRFTDWLAHAEHELATLLGEYDSVAVAGLSLGGTLALNLAARYPVACVAALAAPLYVLNILPWPLTHARFYGASLAAQIRRTLAARRSRTAARQAGQTSSAEQAPSPVAAPARPVLLRGYAGPLHPAQLLSFRQGCADTRALLPRLQAPLLVMHDARDCVVYPGNAWEIMRLAASRDAECVLTRIQDTVSRRHVITMHPETSQATAEKIVALCLKKGLDPTR